ncbi:MAG: sn-glycerol-3-phosphate ABC transporter ATP-binding protein UgpC [Gammaproteobacteria bacterium]
MSDIKLVNVKKSYGHSEILHGIDIDIADGEFVVFVGPSGCGKSTLLRVIAGLESITAGDLYIGGARVNDLTPPERGIAMVFQSYALYPHMTVYKNMAFGLKMANADKTEIDRRVREAARALQLEPLLARKPAQLSGGQRQRVAIGRAIVRQPKVFLFDEPLSNLDAALRVQTRLEIAKLHQDLQTTIIYVTHDQVEAMTLADKIVVLNQGSVAQIGAPLDLYERPRNQFVAGFIGSPKMNFIKGEVAAIRDSALAVKLADGSSATLPVAADGAKIGDAVTLGVRPEHLTTEPDAGAGAQLRGEVEVVERLGDVSYLYLHLGDGGRITVRANGISRARVGDALAVGAGAQALHLFAADGRAFQHRNTQDHHR